MHPNDFPLLRACARNQARFDAALMTIAGAVEAGSIRNVALQDAKSTLSNAVQQAWSRHVTDRHFSGAVWRDGSMTEALQDLYYKINIYGLHDVHAAAKRVAATKVQSPAVDAMRTLLQELLPLAQAVTGLKDKVVKGRTPAAPRPPANPDQLRMTCGCCMRGIAVMGGLPTGTMAHHGYERPGEGWQTASCPGIKFMPLETIDDGPRYMLRVLADQLERARASLARCPSLRSLPVQVYERGVKTVKTITPDMREWRTAYDTHVFRIEREIAGLRRDIATYGKVVQDWLPLTEAARSLLIERNGSIPQPLPASLGDAPAECAADPDRVNADEEAEDGPRGESMTG